MTAERNLPRCKRTALAIATRRPIAASARRQVETIAATRRDARPAPFSVRRMQDALGQNLVTHELRTTVVRGGCPRGTKRRHGSPGRAGAADPWRRERLGARTTHEPRVRSHLARFRVVRLHSRTVAQVHVRGNVGVELPASRHELSAAS